MKRTVKDITREEFEAYEAVRQSGQTNMILWKDVCDLSDDVLDKESHQIIWTNYAELKARFTVELSRKDIERAVMGIEYAILLLKQERGGVLTSPAVQEEFQSWDDTLQRFKARLV